MPYVARHTTLHPTLWRPYSITAYPAGFMGADGQPDLPPVWEPNAYPIDQRRGHACFALLGDAATLDQAIEACWEHYAKLH